jgi:hypothetical protein
MGGCAEEIKIMGKSKREEPLATRKESRGTAAVQKVVRAREGRAYNSISACRFCANVCYPYLFKQLRLLMSE